MAETKLTKCSGCGAEFIESDGPTHRYLGSTPGCWAVYGEVLAREYSNQAYFKVHRLTVDAYALQHPGLPSPQTIQSAAIHLISLYLCLEQKTDPQTATQAMQKAAGDKEHFYWLEPPAARYDITVKDVYAATNPDQHTELVNKWAESAWQAWQIHRATINEWVRLVTG